jgi:hypothetical protein
MARQQLDIRHGQERVLKILDNFASRDLPGRQNEILGTVTKILTCVNPAPAAD